MLQFKKTERTPYETISDAVTAAMETGNPAAAREALAENIESHPDAVKRVHREVYREYGIHL